MSREEVIPISEIRISHNDRTEFDQASIDTLAASIAERGLDNPITVRPLAVDPVDGSWSYQLIAGERRLRAVRSLQLSSIKARVIIIDDKAADLLRLEENLLREDLSEIDKAAGLQRYIELHGESQTVVGKRFGISQGQLSNLLRLLKLTDYWTEQVKARTVPHTLVRDLLLPWCHRPALLDIVAEEHQRLVSDLEEMDRRDLEISILQGIRNLTRSARQVPYSDYMTLNDETCCFRLNDKNRLSLDVDDVPGRGPVAWNVAAWDALNAPALQAYREKLKAAKKARKSPEQSSSNQSPGKGKKKSTEPEPTCDLRRLDAALTKQLRVKLAGSLNGKKHKTTIVRLFMFLAMEDDIGEPLFGKDRYSLSPMKRLKKITDIPDTDLPGSLCDCVAACLNQEYFFDLGAVDVVAMAALLPLDLMHDWVPNSDVLNAYSDSQLVAFAHDAEIDHQQPRKSLIECLLEKGVWQAGFLPAEVQELVKGGDR